MLGCVALDSGRKRDNAVDVKILSFKAVESFQGSYLCLAGEVDPRMLFFFLSRSNGSA